MKLFSVLCNVGKFRTAFDFGGREVAHWFPGHMAKGDRPNERFVNILCLSRVYKGSLVYNVKCWIALTLRCLQDSNRWEPTSKMWTVSLKSMTPEYPLLFLKSCSIIHVHIIKQPCKFNNFKSSFDILKNIFIKELLMYTYECHNILSVY